MDLVRFLYGASRRKVFGLVLASVPSAALAALIHRALVPGGLGRVLIGVTFVLALHAKAATQYVAQAMLVEFAQQVVLDLCGDICDRVLAACTGRPSASSPRRPPKLLHSWPPQTPPPDRA
jgi:hypothetical protein